MRLTKRAVEEMLRTYDDDPLGALTVALRTALDQPNASWDELIAGGPFSGDQRERLLRADETTLDQLLMRLNELRALYN